VEIRAGNRIAQKPSVALALDYAAMIGKAAFVDHCWLFPRAPFLPKAPQIDFREKANERRFPHQKVARFTGGPVPRTYCLGGILCAEMPLISVSQRKNHLAASIAAGRLFEKNLMQSSRVISSGDFFSARLAMRPAF
jgi:hypothetical protein